MREIPASLSVGGYAYQHVTDWLNKYDNQAEKAFKQLAAECAYAGIMLFSAFETVARAAHTLVLKCFSQFVDKSKKKEFIKKHLAPAGVNLLMCASVTGGAVLSLKDNLPKVSFPKKIAGQIVDGNATIDKVTMFYLKTFPNQLRAFGFGFS
jgi:hypothetical protein